MFGISFRYRVTALLVFVAIGVIAIFALQRTPAKFQASANLLVLLSDEYGTRPIATSSAAPQLTAMDRDAYISAETDILTSDVVIDQAIDQIGPVALYPDINKQPDILRSILRRVSNFITGFRPEDADKETLAKRLAHRAVKKGFRVDSGRSGNVIGMTYENTDRVIATRFLAAVIDAYFVRRSILFADEQATILAQQVDAKGQELDKARVDLANFQQKNAIFEFAQQRETLLRRLGELNASLQATEVDALEAQARRKTVVAQLDLLPADSTRISSGQEVVVRRGNFAETLQKETYRLDQELSAAQVRQRALETQIASVQSDLQTLRDRETELDALRLRQSLLERQYAQSVQTLDVRRSVEAVAEARRSNIKLVDNPQMPDRPTSQRLLIAVAGALLALFAASAVLLLGWYNGSARVRQKEHTLARRDLPDNPTTDLFERRRL